MQNVYWLEDVEDMIHLLEDVEDMIQLVIRCGKFERCLRNDAKQYRYRENIDAL